MDASDTSSALYDGAAARARKWQAAASTQSSSGSPEPYVSTRTDGSHPAARSIETTLLASLKSARIGRPPATPETTCSRCSGAPSCQATESRQRQQDGKGIEIVQSAGHFGYDVADTAVAGDRQNPVDVGFGLVAGAEEMKAQARGHGIRATGTCKGAQQQVQRAGAGRQHGADVTQVNETVSRSEAAGGRRTPAQAPQSRQARNRAG